MPKPKIVIDASIIGYAGEPHKLGDLCNEALQRSERLFNLVLDHEGYIAEEYEGLINEKPRDSYVRRWWITITTRHDSRVFRSGKPTRSERRRLEMAKFHDDDYAYVAVAKNARPALLLHEDSDYCNAESVIVDIAMCRCLHPPAFISELDNGLLP